VRSRGQTGRAASALYGEARDRTGKLLGRVTPRLPAGEAAPAAPRLPADLQDGQRMAVDSDGGPRYRVVTERMAGGALVIAAIPLTEVDATLSRLLLIEGLVFGAVRYASRSGSPSIFVSSPLTPSTTRAPSRPSARSR